MARTADGTRRFRSAAELAAWLPSCSGVVRVHRMESVGRVPTSGVADDAPLGPPVSVPVRPVPSSDPSWAPAVSLAGPGGQP